MKGLKWSSKSDWERMKEEFWETILFVLLGVALISFVFLVAWLFAAGMAVAFDLALWQGFIILLIFVGVVFLVGVIGVIIKEWRKRKHE